jgi:hypothetical protein
MFTPPAHPAQAKYPPLGAATGISASNWRAAGHGKGLAVLTASEIIAGARRPRAARPAPARAGC